MATIVKGRGERWEIRESVRTDRGPRSRTLATFRRLDDAVIQRALGRASVRATPEDLIASAQRAGAPIAMSAADEAASQLLAELSAGRAPRPALRRLLRGRLERGTRPRDDVDSATEWLGESAEARGEALRDLLLLAEALPSRPRELRFPPLARH